ncbi:MAG: hypothetical protein LAP40_26055 [Acidobacteriia bacterium]|nr:hypothetical protein [Terriglobia bacterium]
MTGEYISRAALLLQYYAALGELAEEAKLPAKAARGERIPDSFRVRTVESLPAAS